MVYYRWHPLCGQTLPVYRRMKDRHGEHIFCQLPDNSICSLPAWMFNPECLHFTLGPPLIAVAALEELREVLNMVGMAACDKDLGKPSREAIHEATAQAVAPAAESLTNQLIKGSRSQRRRKRTGTGIGRFTDARRSSTGGAARKRDKR